MIFFDTNLFLYAASASPDDTVKCDRARALLRGTDFALSIQVIQEFLDVALRKHRLGISSEAAMEMIELMALYPCAATSPSLIRRAVTFHARYQIRYWDAAILAAAHELGCDAVYSEELNHNQVYDGIRVINPFL